MKNNYIRPVLVNRHKSEYDIYIGRGSIWGNKFEINNAIGDTRQVVVEKYREWLYEQISTGAITIDDFLSLSSKRIGCSCSPLLCHGDIILEVWDEIITMMEE